VRCRRSSARSGQTFRSLVYSAGVGRWRTATWIVAAIWALLMVRLMIADVWDETNGMLFFCDPKHSLHELFAFVLTQSLGFWRPIPTLLAASMMHFVPFDLSWRVLRALNIALLLCAVALLVRTVEAWDGRDPFRDAAALTLTALALLLLSRNHFIVAGLVLGIGFFCKETTALALVFFLPLMAARRLRLRDAVVAGAPAALLGLAYFFLRGRIIAFGSAGDVHTFVAQQYWPSALGFLEGFWRQTMKTNGPTVIGLSAMLLSIAALRKPIVIGALIVFLLAGTVIYWGMFIEYQAGVLISHHNFVGRLFLLPVWLTLTLLALERRALVLIVLLIPILWGGITTYRDHARFQRAYRHIYSMARESPHKPLIVHFPPKPLHDTVRRVEIGDFPNAPLALNPFSGRLQQRR
jgi:hypothetical protein